jgi:hypothetical protein
MTVIYLHNISRMKYDKRHNKEFIIDMLAWI